MKEIITSSEAPAAIGPYSQAVSTGALVFCSGQIPLDPGTGEVVGDDVTSQTEQVLKNLTGLLSGKGLTLDHVVKTTVFLTDLAKFSDMNAVYSKHFRDPFPARSTIQISALPKGALVEIEAIASIS